MSKVYKQLDPSRICNTHGNVFPENTRQAFQDALDDLDARGGGVYLPPIEIAIDATVTGTGTPDEGITIWSTGGSKGGTWDLGCVLKLDNNVNDPILVLGDNANASHRIILEGFAWDGNKANNGSPTANDNDGVVIESAEGCVVKNVVGYNCYNDALVMGTSGQIQSKSTIENSIFSTNGDNGIAAIAQEDWKAYGVHTGSNGTNGSNARGQAGINATAQLVDITACTSIYDQIWLNIRGDRNVISNNIVDKPYVSVIRFFSADGVHVENLQCHDVSYTNNNSPAFDFDNGAHGNFFFDRVTVEPGGGADNPTYIFDLSAVASVDYMSVGQRDFNYQTDMFNGYPSNLSIAPVFEAYWSPTNQLAADNTTRYHDLDGNRAITTTETSAYGAYNRRKLLSDLRFWLSAAPNGATKTRTVTIRESGGDGALTATATDAETNATDATNYVDVAAGNTLNWKFTAANTPDASYIWGTAKVNDLEDLF